MPAPPSLFADTVVLDRDAVAAPPPPPRETGSLVEWLHDGFYMVFLLRSGHRPTDADAFRGGVRAFLDGFDRTARRLGRPAEDVHDAKFAFCALVDETLLRSDLPIREAWRRRPLQLELFGEQLAGERFFELLEGLRALGPERIEVLEVHHMCLLLGFQGRYLLEGPEKLGYLTSRVGEEIAGLRGRRPSFAPHAAAPDRVVHALQRDVPPWVVASVFAFFGLVGFAGLRWGLDRQTQADLAGYSNVVTLAPQAAWFEITLP